VSTSAMASFRAARASASNIAYLRIAGAHDCDAAPDCQGCLWRQQA
jgi:hypothetical protein